MNKNNKEKIYLNTEKEYKRIYDFYNKERKIKEKYSFVVGIDEAGRGALAGPICVACVCLPTGVFIEGLNDSKKISQKKRKNISKIIIKKSFFYSFGYSSVKEIEKYNILEATFIAIKRALKKITYPIEYVLLDGNSWPKNFNYSGKTIIKGDNIMPSIAAASILAKTKRDSIMEKIDKIFFQYDFKNNKGYGTKKHYASIHKFGLSKHHRCSFLKGIS